ncbi:hypothetical protein QFX18_12710 [Saccharophagus degradans]|uniref:hypothetical protein n=1 Tax=Saccharophagus degradans TaxID=86304 RepID=UPI002477E440|nr:hypothetical protein [Saccharophagus degradans]WGO96907.1 hypothetical protein QFX18_12710 [Saccharophagus degradans]
MNNNPKILYHRDLFGLAKKPLYKYQTKENAIKTVNHGSFRIGTLYDYRDIEQYGSEIGDVGEGTRSVESAIGEEFLLTGENSNAKGFVSGFIPQVLDRNMWISDVQFRRRDNSPDRYLYCVSSEPSRDAMLDFECDTALEITDWPKFFYELRASLRMKVRLQRTCHIMPCIYGDRMAHYSELDENDILQLKPREMEYQKEWRAAWTPVGVGGIKPIIIHSPKAKKYCRIIEL